MDREEVARRRQVRPRDGAGGGRSELVVGTITVDDVMDVVQEGVGGHLPHGGSRRRARAPPPRQVAMLRRLGDATLLIEMLAASSTTSTRPWEGHAGLFMPVIQAISGNTGLQSVTMVVRGLATGQVQLNRWWEPLWRQIQTSAILGAVCGLAVGLIGFLWHSFTFGFVVATSMFVSVNLSGCAGTAIQMLSKHLGFDPALTAGPFETAFQDVLGVTIFLLSPSQPLHPGSRPRASRRGQRLQAAVCSFPEAPVLALTQPQGGYAHLQPWGLSLGLLGPWGHPLEGCFGLRILYQYTSTLLRMSRGPKEGGFDECLPGGRWERSAEGGAGHGHGRKTMGDIRPAPAPLRGLSDWP
jgi:hypothetical protein